jgi:hypothetical protein
MAEGAGFGHRGSVREPCCVGTLWDEAVSYVGREWVVSQHPVPWRESGLGENFPLVGAW